MQNKTTLLFIIAQCFIFYNIISAQNDLKFTDIATGLDTPWEIAWGPDDHIWFTERKGDVSRVDPVTKKLEKIATIDEVVESSEAGLMGMAFHPSFQDTPHVFLAYNYRDGNHLKVKVSRFVYQNNTLNNPMTIIDGIPGAQIHDGCRLIITPDRKLLITTGDAGDQSLPQNNNSRNGKLLRLNLDGSIPSDNPFSGNPMWSKGHRNAQGLVMANGIIYSSEHGPANDDEFNIVKKGRNYGWPNVQGFCNLFVEQQFCQDSNVAEPLLAWTPTLAVAGIDYYGQSRINSFRNSILLTSLKAGVFIVISLNEQGDAIIDTAHILKGQFGRLRDVCVSPQGKVYIATSNRDGRGVPRPGDDRIIEIDGINVNIDQEDRSNGMKIYPNPVQQNIHLHLPGQYQEAMICLYSFSGTKVDQWKLNGEEHFSIPVGNFPKGMYLLRLTAGEMIMNRKVMVE